MHVVIEIHSGSQPIGNIIRPMGKFPPNVKFLENLALTVNIA